MNTHTTPFALLSIAALFAAAGSAVAQSTPQQKVTGPNARYWLSAETSSGFAMGGMQGGGGGGGGMAAMMAAALGGGGPRKALRLELSSVKAANPAEAVHQLAPALNMGASLPLFGERSGGGEPVERDIPEMPDKQEKPKGRMLFFWGCGENAGAGQPVVLDFAQLANGVLPPNMRSVSIRAQRGLPNRGSAFAEWPNRKDSRAVPAQASLTGAHTVSGGFIPDIRFSVDSATDFMDGLSLQQASSPGGGQRLQWNAARTALGYFASGMGFKQVAADNNDIVFWNSSSARLLGGEQLMGFLAPAETERLVRDKVVLPASTTECVVPKEAVAAAGGPLMMVNLNAFGPELNVVHPPRPQDPKVDWNQEYAVKLRLRSYTGAVGGMGSGAEAAQNNNNEAPAGGEKASVKDQAKSILKGIFGK